MFVWLKRNLARKRNGERLYKEVEKAIENILNEYSLPDSDIFMGVKKYLVSLYNDKKEEAYIDVAKFKLEIIQKLDDIQDIIKISFVPEYQAYRKKAYELLANVKIDIIKIFESTNENTKIYANPFDANFIVSLTRFKALLSKRHD